MNFQRYWIIAWEEIMPVILSAILVSIPLLIVYKSLQSKTPSKQAPANGIYIIAFALFGAVIGYCVGASRESAVGTVIPAVLTVLTVLSGYAFTKEGLKDQRPLIPYLLLAWMLMSLFWLIIGSIHRFDYDRWVERNQKSLLQFERVDLELQKALAFKNAGLPAPTTESGKDNVFDPLKPGLPAPSKGTH
jgi:hypothetical protein